MFTFCSGQFLLQASKSSLPETNCYLSISGHWARKPFRFSQCPGQFIENCIRYIEILNRSICNFVSNLVLTISVKVNESLTLEIQVSRSSAVSFVSLLVVSFMLNFYHHKNQ